MPIATKTLEIATGIGFLLFVITVIGMIVFYNTSTFSYFQFLGLASIVLWGWTSFKLRKRLNKQKNEQK